MRKRRGAAHRAGAVGRGCVSSCCVPGRQRRAPARRLDRGARRVRRCAARAESRKRSKDSVSPRGGSTSPMSSSTRANAPTGCTSNATTRGAARVAVWLAWDYWAFRGEDAVANGWLQRARRLLDGQPALRERAWLELREGSLRSARGGRSRSRARAWRREGLRIARAAGSDRSRDAGPRRAGARARDVGRGRRRHARARRGERRGRCRRDEAISSRSACRAAT